MTAELESPNAIPVPTIHVLFTRPLPLTIVPRVFPYVPPVPPFQKLRDDLISWIADEGLAGDRDAAEWVLLCIIAKVYVCSLQIGETQNLSRYPANRDRPRSSPNP